MPVVANGSPDLGPGGGQDRRWHPGPLVGFDLETTGIDPTAARIVTASLVFFPAGCGAATAHRGWLVDPGIPIPEEAAAIHGVTTEHAQAHGRPAGRAVPEILEQVDRVWNSGIPMVVFNAPYDLTVLEAEAARHGLVPPSGRAGWRRAVVLDPLVIDRRVDRFRPGRRTLQASAVHYGVTAEAPHSSDGDAAAACLVARAIADRFRWIGRVPPLRLHAVQVDWYRQWAVRFQEYLRTNGRPDDTVDPDWPARSRGACAGPEPVLERGKMAP